MENGADILTQHKDRSTIDHMMGIEWGLKTGNGDTGWLHGVVGEDEYGETGWEVNDVSEVWTSGNAEEGNV